ncbi:2,3-diaminopropionate biosynthesis protein SbnB [Motilibacter deserti]|uniref:2,3-diaminopropionate biosynthesis protein SbnB n=1 Tax=Motilibacter deserti TaxID=2714956 RepID=A0ABX0H1X0_9ACTN|nr:2,3-diaminopropionate biosynthesis protein SbnB [Motilibacter deserti]
MRPPGFGIVSAADIAAQIDADRPACLEAVRQGYLAHASGNAVNPHSSFLRLPGHSRDRIIALPAYLGGDFDVAGIKWIASYPGNVQHGIARASAVLVLNDMQTGYPYACMEASLISATRTAASAVLAAEALCGRRSTGRIGFVGTGLIARHVHAFFRDLGWDVGGYRCFDLDRTRAEKFAAAAQEDGQRDVEVVEDDAAAFHGCDVVVLATVAGEPYLQDPSLLAHKPVVLHLSLRDLAPELVLSAQNLTDDPDHAVREKTSLHLAEQQVGDRSFVHGTLAQLLRGEVARDESRAVVFSPFGLGVLDLAVGKHVYDRASAGGRVRPVDSFFPEGVAP